MQDPLHIFQVAIEYEGTVYSMERPHRHHHIIRKIIENTKAKHVYGKQGFIDPRSGGFMDREEAAEYAITIGQIESTRWGDQLFSEDLW